MATIGETVSGGTAGSVLFVGAGPVLAQDNANLFWDNTNKKLGIGTTSPLNDLTVRKSDTGTLGIDVINTNTTSAAANAQVFVQVAGANAGDAVTKYEILNVTSWIVGIDNSDSDKFKFVASTQSVQVCLVMTTDGKIGVTEPNPTARLHLPAGTASVAPLKLTSGTNLSPLQDGAVEWDGTKLYITSGTKRRQLGYNEVANVLDFGAKGDGTDDSGAFQAAVNSIVNTGGVVLVPSDKVYGIGSKVTIKSKYSIWILSWMTGRGTGGGGGTTNADRGLLRPVNNLDYMFEWTKPDDPDEWGEGGGGGIQGLSLTDWDAGLGTPQNYTIEAAIRVHTPNWFCINCTFEWLDGRAIKFDTTIFGQLRNVKIYNCGAPGKPPVDIDGGSIMTAEQVWRVNADSTVFAHTTIAYNSANPADLQFFPGGAVGEYVAFGYDEKFSALTFANSNGTPGVGGTVRWEYWNGTTWATLPLWADWTYGFTGTGDRQHVVFVAPNDWQAFSLNGSAALYYVRALVTQAYSTNPVYDRGWAPSNGQVWWDRGFVEGSVHGSEQAVRVNVGCSLVASGLYFEDVLGSTSRFIDASESGALDVSDSSFNATSATSIIVGGTRSALKGCRFNNNPGSNPTIRVDGLGFASILSDLHLTTGGAHTGRNVQLDASFCQLNGIYLNGGGGIGGSGIFNMLSDIYVYAPSASSGQYAIALGADWTLNGGILDLVSTDGSNGSVCHGIQANGASVSGMRVIRRRTNSIGIASTQARDVIAHNFVDDTYGGTRFSFSTNCTASGNRGYAPAANAIDNMDGTCSVTHHAESGVITVPNASVTAGSEYLVLVTNNLVNTTSRITVSVSRGDDTQAVRYLVRTVELNNGSFEVAIKNDSGATQNGTWLLRYSIDN